MEAVRKFLARKNIVFSARRYFIDAMGAMAQGLFCTLLVGTILNTIGQQLHIGFLTEVIVTLGKGEGAVTYTIGGLCSAMVGPGMAVAIGRALEAPPLVLYSLIPVGFATNYMGGAGGPLAVLFVAILAAEIGKAVSKETKIDILVTPIVTTLAGIGIAALIAAPIGTAASAVGRFIMWATELQPFFMGIIVSVVIGVALTLPISSAAICAALGLTGLAGGAAVAGCCAQMIGFAVMSFRENRWGGLAAQGLGTSMLQMGNIVRNPRVWIPPTLASAITGPIATCLFRLEMNGAAASAVGRFIMWATELQPFFMGIIVSVVIGVALTLPISSAAICAALGLTGLAGGAAVAGCCAQMIGFAVMSFRENRWGGLAAQGLGTSMLQMGNIVRNPRVWIPPTLASAITGPIATCLFRLEMNGAAVSSGMGTCGLVGQIGVYTGWVSDVAAGVKAGITGMDWLGLVLISFVLPAVLTWLLALPLRKWKWIKEGDLALDL